jgi:hypothetical protein
VDLRLAVRVVLEHVRVLGHGLVLAAHPELVPALAHVRERAEHHRRPAKHLARSALLRVAAAEGSNSIRRPKKAR